MTGALLQIAWINMRRDHTALALMFVMPIIFFSIFAGIFANVGGRPSGSSARKIKVVLVDQDNTEVSKRFAIALGQQGALSVVTSPASQEDLPKPPPYDRDSARRRVRKGAAAVAVVIPPGFGASFGDFSGKGEAIELLYDAANPIALPTVSGLLQAAAMSAAPDVIMDRGLGMLEAAGGTLSPIQRQLIRVFKTSIRGATTDQDGKAGDGSPKAAAAKTSSSASGLVRVSAVDVRTSDEPNESTKRKTPIVAYYAAGIGVMFLLFSMASGAGGTLLDEEERGTLERLMTSNVPMTTLLLAHWLFFTLAGIMQVTMMFVWGALVFDLELWTLNRLVGFALMTVITACAATGFGILLAALSRSRAQLGGMSTIIILIMSAVGGSMVPRMIMPAFMDTAALFTFNGWAIDGYLKVFWYDEPGASLLQTVTSIVPQLAMLSAVTAVFLGVARLLARRWEAV